VTKGNKGQREKKPLHEIRGFRYTHPKSKKKKSRFFGNPVFSDENASARRIWLERLTRELDHGAEAAASDAAAGGEGEKDGGRERGREGLREGGREEHSSDVQSLGVNAQQASSLGMAGDWAAARVLLPSAMLLRCITTWS
jgi:hypothetical protein